MEEDAEDEEVLEMADLTLPAWLLVFFGAEAELEAERVATMMARSTNGGEKSDRCDMVVVRGA